MNYALRLQCQDSLWGVDEPLVASFIQQKFILSAYNYIGIIELCTHRLQCQDSLWGVHEPHVCIKVHSVSIQLYRHQWTMHSQIAIKKTHCERLMSPMFASFKRTSLVAIFIVFLSTLLNTDDIHVAWEAVCYWKIKRIYLGIIFHKIVVFSSRAFYAG